VVKNMGRKASIGKTFYFDKIIFFSEGKNKKEIERGEV
jgi:hypothetical protein